LNKIVGCRVSDEIYDKINDLDVSQSDFLRILIDNYFSNLDIESIIDVNGSKEGVNSKKIDEEKLKQIIYDFKNSKQLNHLAREQNLKLLKEIFSSEESKRDFVNFVMVAPVSKNLLDNCNGISSWGKKYNEMEKWFEMIFSIRILTFN
jgi:hypothetical protein